MRWCLLSFLMVACGAPAPAAHTPPASPPANHVPQPAATEASVEDVAVRFATAALSGDRTTARSLVISGDEAVTFSNKADKAEWDAEVADLVDRLGAEGSRAKQGGKQLRVESAEVVQRRTLDPATDEKVRQRLDVAIVKIRVSTDGGPADGPPFLFIKTANGWKLSPKH